MKYLWFLTLAILVTGCDRPTTPMIGNVLTPYGADTPKVRFLDVAGKHKLLAWDDGSTVAYVNENGQACILAASVDKSDDVNIKVGLKDFTPLDVTDKGTVVQLLDKNAANTALDIGLFHYCMLTNNGKVNEEQLKDFITELGNYMEKANSGTAAP